MLTAVAVALGLIVAVTYGTSDFVGGLVSRERPVLQVVATGQLVAVVLVALAMAVSASQHDPIGVDMARGVGSGICVTVGLVLLFRGLAAGAMSVVAPITAVGAAVLPFAWGLLRGERPGWLAVVGALVAIVAVVLVARPADDAPHGRVPAKEIVGAVIAGIGFGGTFILLGDTSEASGLWPVLMSKVTVAAVVTTLATMAGARPSRGPHLRLVAAGGALDAVANTTYLLATRSSLVSVVAVVGSLYPALTLLLARVVLNERTSAVQRLGLGLALGGVLLLAAG